MFAPSAAVSGYGYGHIGAVRDCHGIASSRLISTLHGDRSDFSILKLGRPLGSRLVNVQSQKMTVAARATADRKTFGHLS